MTHISITTNTPAVGAHRIEVDGQDISSGVRAATLWLHPGELPELDLELHVVEVQRIDSAEAKVVVPDATREALVKLGWTPPPEDP